MRNLVLLEMQRLGVRVVTGEVFPDFLSGMMQYQSAQSSWPRNCCDLSQESVWPFPVDRVAYGTAGRMSKFSRLECQPFSAEAIGPFHWPSLDRSRPMQSEAEGCQMPLSPLGSRVSPVRKVAGRSERNFHWHMVACKTMAFGQDGATFFAQGEIWNPQPQERK